MKQEPTRTTVCFEACNLSDFSPTGSWFSTAFVGNHKVGGQGTLPPRQVVQRANKTGPRNQCDLPARRTETAIEPRRLYAADRRAPDIHDIHAADAGADEPEVNGEIHLHGVDRNASMVRSGRGDPAVK